VQLGAALLAVCAGCEAAGTDGAPVAAPSPPAAQSQLPPGHPPVDPPGGSVSVPAPFAGTGSGEAGLIWQDPAGWIVETPANSMRRAQYSVPGSGGDAECVVFYFGPGQGGDATSNAERWAGQFTQPDGGSSLERMQTETIRIDDLAVVFVEVSGTYSGGMMSGPPLELADYALVGAIVEGPDANWFFKLTGPAATVHEQRDAFMTMIRSLSRGSSFT
jgi:hypothetical protein